VSDRCSFLDRRIPRRNRGQNLFLFAASFATLMALLMLLVDFGGAAMTFHRAQVAADAAAFAAAQGIDLDTFYRTQAVELSHGAAAGLAGQFMSINSRGTVQITNIYVEEDLVHVSATASYRSLFAHYIGLGTIRLNVHASAAPAYGIRERDE